MKQQLKNILDACLNEISDAKNAKELSDIKTKYMGKKGLLTGILRGMGKLTSEERPIIGALANTVREKIEERIVTKSIELKEDGLSSRLKDEIIDVTMPGKKVPIGRLHPITQVENQMINIFVSMGFDVVEGPEIESTHNNFDALNAPIDHPSRDYQDTFYITEEYLLRTQTSPVQIRTMRSQKPPLRIISPGRVYRCDQIDATHSPMFHQLEGLVVDKGINMGHLKATLSLFAKSMFGDETKTRFRPHNFPFTEPSAEVDLSCFICKGTGCRLCKNEGWIEILGAGMVHPNVLAGCDIDPDIYTGFAFGVGLDRVAILKYGIDNMRLLFENDSRFLKQF